MNIQTQVVKKTPLYEKNEIWMHHLEKLKNICTWFKKTNNKPMGFSARGDANSYPYLCIDFHENVSCSDLKKIRIIFVELGYIFAPHDKGEKCSFATIDISTVKNPVWFDKITGISANNPTREEIRGIFDLLETKTKIYYLTKSSKNKGKGVDTASCPFPDNNTLEMFYDEMKSKFPDACIEKTGKGSIHIGLKYITKDAHGKIKIMTPKVGAEKTPMVQKVEIEPVQKISDSAKIQPEIIIHEEVKVIDTPEYSINQFGEIIHKKHDRNLQEDLTILLKKHGLIPEPEKVDMTELVKLPSKQETITLPMEALFKLDGSGIEIRVEALRNFLQKNFPIS